MKTLTRTLVLIAAVLLLTSTAAQPTSGAREQESFHEAFRFRAMMGFSTDVATLEALADDPNARYSEYPIPLSKAEKTELDRRTFVQEHKRQLVDYLEALDTFAGLWTDQAAGGIVNIAFTDDPTTHLNAVRQRAPVGAILELRHAQFSRAELNAWRDQIEADQYRYFQDELGVSLNELGFRIQTNEVRVGISPLTESVRQSLRQRYPGAPLNVYEASVGDVTACTSRSHCIGPPWRAGILGSPYGCSMAFIAYRNVTGADPYYIMTAGHCANNGSAWTHDGKSMGTMSHDTYFTNSTADAALIGPIATADISRNVYNTFNSVNPMISRDDYVPDDDPGDSVCLSARMAEAVRCGTILDDDYWIKYASGIILNHQILANYAWQIGDSGGAIFWVNTAKGIQSGFNQDGYAVYSHTHYVMSQTTAWVNVSL